MNVGIIGDQITKDVLNEKLFGVFEKHRIIPDTICVIGIGVSNMAETIAYKQNWKIKKFLPEFKKYHNTSIAIRQRNISFCADIDFLIIVDNQDQENKYMSIVIPAQLRDIPVVYLFDMQ